jgi:hypothetical protein
VKKWPRTITRDHIYVKLSCSTLAFGKHACVCANTVPKENMSSIMKTKSSGYLIQGRVDHISTYFSLLPTSMGIEVTAERSHSEYPGQPFRKP